MELPDVTLATPRKYWELGNGRIGVLFGDVHSAKGEKIHHYFCVFKEGDALLHVTAVSRGIDEPPELLLKDSVSPSSWGRDQRWEVAGEFEKQALALTKAKIPDISPVPLAEAEAPRRTWPPAAALLGLVSMVLFPAGVGVLLLKSAAEGMENASLVDWLGILAGIPIMIAGMVVGLMAHGRWGPFGSKLCFVIGAFAGTAVTGTITGLRDAGLMAWILALVLLPVVVCLGLAFAAFLGHALCYGMTILLVGLAGPLTALSLEEGWIPWAVIAAGLLPMLASWPAFLRWTRSLPPKIPRRSSG